MATDCGGRRRPLYRPAIGGYIDRSLIPQASRSGTPAATAPAGSRCSCRRRAPRRPWSRAVGGDDAGEAPARTSPRDRLAAGRVMALAIVRLPFILAGPREEYRGVLRADPCAYCPRAVGDCRPHRAAGAVAATPRRQHGRLRRCNSRRGRAVCCATCSSASTPSPRRRREATDRARSDRRGTCGVGPDHAQRSRASPTLQREAGSPSESCGNGMISASVERSGPSPRPTPSYPHKSLSPRSWDPLGRARLRVRGHQDNSPMGVTRRYTDPQRDAIVHAVLVDGLSRGEARRLAEAGKLADGLAPFRIPYSSTVAMVAKASESFFAEQMRKPTNARACSTPTPCAWSSLRTRPSRRSRPQRRRRRQPRSGRGQEGRGCDHGRASSATAGAAGGEAGRPAETSSPSEPDGTLATLLALARARRTATRPRRRPHEPRGRRSCNRRTTGADRRRRRRELRTQRHRRTCRARLGRLARRGPGDAVERPPTQHRRRRLRPGRRGAPGRSPTSGCRRPKPPR